MQPPPLKSRKSFPWLLVCISAGLLLTLLLAILAHGFISFLGSASAYDYAIDQYPAFTEEWSFGEGETKAVRIALEGVLFRESTDGLFGSRYDKIEEVLRQIRAAGNDEGVRAVILEVDSPGGAITPSDEIYHALRTFRDSQEGRVVVVFVRDMAASGAYYAAVAGNHLIAEPTAIVGSIGVIMQTLNWKVLSEKIGLTDTTIKSGQNKDLLNPFHDVPEEQRALLQQMIDAMHARFVEIVARERGLEPAALATLADGRIFTAEAAKEQRLIDEIGYWEDAVARTAALLDEESISVVRYLSTPDFWEWLGEVRNPLAPLMRGGGVSPRPLYLWNP